MVQGVGKDFILGRYLRDEGLHVVEGMAMLLEGLGMDSLLSRG